MEKNKFCSAFDYAYTTKYKKFIELIITLCLTKAAVKRSLIVPKSLSAITNLATDEEKIVAVQKHVLRVNFTVDRLRELGEKSAKIFTLAKDSHYVVTLKDSDILLNGVAVDVVQALDTTTLYIAKGDLISASSEDKAGGSRNKKKYKRGSKKEHKNKHHRICQTCKCKKEEEPIVKIEEFYDEEEGEEEEGGEEEEEEEEEVKRGATKKPIKSKKPRKLVKSRKSVKSKIIPNKRISSKKKKISKDAESIVKTIMI